MKLIIIYGPPAIGKFTVAKELAKLTSYKVFHNHIALDAVESVFTSDKKIFWSLVSEFRLRIIEEAAKENIPGVIFTSGYHGQPLDPTLKKIITKVKKHKGKVYFVHLIADRKELFKRVTSAERRRYLKTRTASDLKRRLANWDMTKDVPFKEPNLTIDNTKLSARTVSRMIKKYYKL
jgi:shikimate kinase